MDIRLLHEFIVLANCLNFHSAADSLHITQPTLSRHIAILEKELGHPLLKRSTRRVELSEFGKTILDDASNISGLYQSMLFRVTEQDNSCSLHIGGFIPHEDLEQPLTMALERLRHDYPWIIVRESNILAQDYTQYLLEDIYDLVITPCSTPNKDARFSFHYIFSSPLRVWMSKDNPLSAYKSLTTSDLESQSLRFMSMDDHESWNDWRQFIFSLFENDSVTLNIKPPTGPSMTLSADEFALTPSGEPGMYRGRIAIVPLENAPSVDFYIITKSITDNPAIPIFIEEMLKVCQPADPDVS